MLRIFRKQPHQLTDQELLEQYRSSEDLEYLGVLYERYVELVYGVCLKYLKDQQKAEDAVMAIFEELIEKVKKHDVEKFRPWLHVLTRNHCLMYLRKQNRNLTVSYEPGLMQSVDSRHHSIEIEDSENGELENLQDCMGQLPDQQKECIKLFYYDNKSYKEIAEMKELAVGKIRSYIQNGRRNLKICLEKKNMEQGITNNGQ